jgi:hypothetical protein
MQNPMQDLGDIIIGDALGVPLRLEAPSVSGIYLLQITKETAEDPAIIWKKLSELLTGTNGYIQKHHNATLHDSVIFEDVDGNIRMGTGTPGFKLDVAGKINSSDSVLSDLGEFGSSLQANGLTGMVARGVENDESITFLTRDQARVVIDEDGNVGIGTETPESKFHILRTITGASITIEAVYAGIGAAGILFKKAQGTVATPLAILTNSQLGAFTWRGHDGTDFKNLAAFRVTAEGVVNKAFFSWLTAPAGDATLVEQMRLTSDGKLGIGTTSPDYTLHCIGDISGSAYRVGSTPGIDMASGTPTCVVINKGIVTAATRVIPIADGNYRISDGDTITTVGGIITAIS